MAKIRNEKLREAVLWALEQGKMQEGVAEVVMNHFSASKVLGIAAANLFCAGFNPRKGKANLIREAIIHLDATGELPK